MKIRDKFENILKEYCEENDFDYNKLVSLPRCGNDSMLFIQNYDSKETGNGLKNNIPAEIVLSVTIENDGTVSIESGENAKKYLHI